MMSGFAASRRVTSAAKLSFTAAAMGVFAASAAASFEFSPRLSPANVPLRANSATDIPARTQTYLDRCSLMGVAFPSVVDVFLTHLFAEHGLILRCGSGRSKNETKPTDPKIATIVARVP